MQQALTGSLLAQESLVSAVVEAACHPSSPVISNAALQALAAIGQAFPELAFTHSMEVSRPCHTLHRVGSLTTRLHSSSKQRDCATMQSTWRTCT